MPRYSKNRFGPVLTLIENEVDIQATLLEKYSKEHYAFQWTCRMTYKWHGISVTMGFRRKTPPRPVEERTRSRWQREYHVWESGIH